MTEDLIAGAAQSVCGTTELEYQGTPVSLSRPWRRVSMADLVKEKMPTFDFYALREVRACIYICIYVYVYRYIDIYIYIYWTSSRRRWQTSTFTHCAR